MKKLLLETSFSKIYIVVMMLITLLIVGGYFSYEMFTVSKEKSNAISIVTGNLTYKLTIDGEEGNKLTVGAGETKEFTVTLSNPNNRTARFNFYYEDNLPSGVEAGYKTGDGLNIPMEAIGSNLTASGSAGSSNIYKIRVKNESSSSVTVTLGVGVGLDYNDLTLPSNGHLFEEYTGEPVADVLLSAIEDGTLTSYDDGTDTFITGTDPNNYIWYSGKLWRAVSVNNVENTTKLVTQWNISAIPYNSSNNDSYEDIYIREWLNDTSIDGFLANLRKPENFIVMDAKWDATMDSTAQGSIERPIGTTIVTDAVGLLNAYEYQSSYHGTTYSNGYINNGLNWYTLTLRSTGIRYVSENAGLVIDMPGGNIAGIRPSINLKSNVRIVDGDGTVDNPYRLNGDNDTELSGTLLSSRYSGEYITFGRGENNLYRIVSHENGIGTKIVSAEPLKSSGTFITSEFGSNTTFSSTNTVGIFLNNDYLNIGNGYLTNEDIAMIEDSTTWYLGTVGNGTSYKLVKYTDANMSGYTTTTDAKVGLLRMGELMSGQFDRGDNNTTYLTLTPYSSSYVRFVDSYGGARSISPSFAYGVRPSINLKSNIKITSGTGTKSEPFVLTLGS